MSSQTRAVISLALLYSVRMLGLFMVLPVMLLFGADYAQANPAKLGLALGIYGLTQAIFQIPLGLLSDIVGRKLVIASGLVIFALGSFIAATTDSVYGLILGRALQGSGAIASAIMALVADLTTEESRTKAMASIGASIGLSFALAIVLGPAVASLGGLTAIFYLSVILAGLGLVVLFVIVPNPSGDKRLAGDTDAIPVLLASTLKVGELLRLNVGIFSLHAILMACFVAIPFALGQALSIDGASHWKVYLPVLLCSFVIMVPFIIYAEKNNAMKGVFLAAICTLVISLLSLNIMVENAFVVIAALFTFFVAFNFLEASLPSLVSKIAPARSKGTAMGIYSTCQFFGAFLGGTIGGWVAQTWGFEFVFAVAAGLGVVWFLIASPMKPPKSLKRMSLEVSATENILSKALAIDGVEEANYVAEERRLYLKVDKRRVNEDDIRVLSA